MVEPRKILLISHAADRSGAVLSLLALMRWCKLHTNLRFEVLLCRTGELEFEFAELWPTWRLDRRRGRKAALSRAVRNWVGDAQERRTLGLADLAHRLANPPRFGLVYSNTVMNGEILAALAHSAGPVLTHVHELELAIQARAGAEFDRVRAFTQRYIAVSSAVRRNLVERHRIPAGQIESVLGFIPPDARPADDLATGRNALTVEIGIPPNAFIVGGCGVAYWMKGHDLFIELGHQLRSRVTSSPVHLVWVGPLPEGAALEQLDRDLSQSGLKSFVHFIGPRANPLPYFACFDVFALVSREESLSLSMLETARLGVPTVCFRDAGGAEEFVGNDCGLIVPYLDVAAMADGVATLLGDEELRKRLGERARRRVAEFHDIETAAPKIVSIMENMLADANAH